MVLNPTAALIIIGNEILSGRTQDVHTSFLAKELGTIGIRLVEVRIIPDVTEQIIQTIHALRRVVSYVFTTGGIGPTHDDITSAAVAEAFQVRLIRHPDAVQRLKEYYQNQPLNDARLKMAEIPEGATLIDNPVSSAPGYCIENVYVMAGVPRIMQAMFAAIKPTLHGGEAIYTQELTAYISESRIAAELTAIQNQFPTVEIGSYPFREHQRYGTHLVLRSTHKSDIQQATLQIEALISAYPD